MTPSMPRSRSRVWEQVYVPSLPFETLDSFLAVPEPPEPWVLVDLADIWVPNKGVPVPVRDEIERLALRAMKMCTEPEEWLWAWRAPDEYSDWLYRFSAASSGAGFRLGSELLPRRGRLWSIRGLRDVDVEARDF